MFNDPTLRKTNFVMLHGGAGDFEQLVPYLLMKPNVYADFSEQTVDDLATTSCPASASCWSSIPRKSCSGPTCIPGRPQVNWEEMGYQTAHKART